MLKEYFQRRCLRKYASRKATGLVPLGRIKSAVALIDVEDTSFDDCKAAIQAFFRDHGIKGEIFFFDFRKLSSGERLITSITTTVLKKDLNWYGRPSQEKVRLMLECKADLFISLLPANSFAQEYMASVSEAVFKAGRTALPVFDLVFKDPEGRQLSQIQAFGEITKLLEKIV